VWQLRLRSAFGWGRNPEALLVPVYLLIGSFVWTMCIFMLPTLRVYIYTNRFPTSQVYWQHLIFTEVHTPLMLLWWLPIYALWRNFVGWRSKRSPMIQMTGRVQQLQQALPRNIYVQIGYAAESHWFCFPAAVEILFADATPSDLFELTVVTGNGYVQHLKRLGANPLALSFDPPRVVDDEAAIFDADEEENIATSGQPTRAKQRLLIKEAKSYPTTWGGSPAHYQNTAIAILVCAFIIWGVGVYIFLISRHFFYLPDLGLVVAIAEVLCFSRHYSERFQQLRLTPNDIQQSVTGIIANWAASRRADTVVWLLNLVKEDGSEELFCANLRFEQRVQALGTSVRVTYIPRTGLVLNVVPLDLPESLLS
jgi:hypothetical protein